MHPPVYQTFAVFDLDWRHSQKDESAPVYSSSVETLNFFATDAWVTNLRSSLTFTDKAVSLRRLLEEAAITLVLARNW